MAFWKFVAELQCLFILICHRYDRLVVRSQIKCRRKRIVVLSAARAQCLLLTTVSFFFLTLQLVELLTKQ